MQYKSEIRGRQSTENKINNLNTMLQAMQSDFAECARGKSPCFFCAKDETCTCTDDKDCEFVWAKHI